MPTHQLSFFLCLFQWLLHSGGLSIVAFSWPQHGALQTLPFLWSAAMLCKVPSLAGSFP